MRFLFILFILISTISFSQARISYGVGGVLPAGISFEYSLFNGKIRPELGVGVFGAWVGSDFSISNEWYVGAGHGLQMIPSVGGWRSLVYGSKTWDSGTLMMSLGGGCRLDWFDRIPYPYPVIVFRVRRR
jgi:hypothetical protein